MTPQRPLRQTGARAVLRDGHNRRRGHRIRPHRYKAVKEKQDQQEGQAEEQQLALKRMMRW